MLVYVILYHTFDSKDTIDDTCKKVQILTQFSHHLTLLFKYFHDHSLTEVGLPIFRVGNAKTIYPSLNGKNNACVSDVRSYG